MVHYADGQERQLDRRLKTEEILDETLSPRNAAQHENYSSTTDPYQASKADSIISHETCQQQLYSVVSQQRTRHAPTTHLGGSRQLAPGHVYIKALCPLDSLINQGFLLTGYKPGSLPDYYISSTVIRSLIIVLIETSRYYRYTA